MRWVLVFLGLACAILEPTQTRAEGGKFALVVGNGGYKHVRPLANPENDAALARQVFEALGFEVATAIDTDSAALRAELAGFNAHSHGAETALIYFAGHGIQADNRNYLLTTDTLGVSLGAAVQSSVSLDEVIAAFPATARAKVLLLDACRNNPFAEASRSILGAASDGLARANHEREDLLVVYAAQPNRVALDGRGANSPFMTALSSILLETSAPHLQDALIDVTNYVRTATAGRQTPYLEGSLSFRIPLAPPGGTTPQDIPAYCNGEARTLGFDPVPEDFVELPGSDRHLFFGDRVRVCTDDTQVRVSGPFAADFSCETLLTSPDEGAGYYFAGPDDAPHHLWFYVDPNRQPRALEIGVHREEEEIYWIDTQIPICTQ